MITKIGNLHFTIQAQLVVDLVRQAYWMENRQKWALDTLKCFQGITDAQIDAILRGTATLESTPDCEQAVFVERPDVEWQKKLAEHLEWVEETTYTFAGRRVGKRMLDHYAENVVGRLRATLRFGISLFVNPQVLMDLEQQRQDEHDEILKAAGFGEEEIENRKNPLKWTPEYEQFDKEFSKFLDKKAGKFFDIGSEEDEN